MTQIRRIQDAEVAGKRVLVRVDFNVPMKDGAVSDDTRLKAALPTIEYLQERGAKTILLAHFGRPKGQRVAEMSLEPVGQPLADLLGSEVCFVDDTVGDDALSAIADLNDGDVLLLQNTRYEPGEEKNDPDFAQALADLGDIYVNDAFSAAHRAHGTTEGVARILPAYAGLAMQREIDHLVAALEKPERPVIALVGGAKVSTKIELLQNLVKKVDILFVGGGMANTLLFAQGVEIGKSLCEKDLVDTARMILANAEESGCKLMLPSDVVLAKEFAPNPETRLAAVSDVHDDEMILDCGPATVTALSLAMDGAKTLIWNGPLGAFETPPFHAATVAAANQAANLAKADGLVAVAGGGDTVAALNQAGVADDFTFISTAGGAFLEWMEGKELPGVSVLVETTAEVA
ncbi:MAG: phosphoglycerate kinase [Maricaulis sp.]|uniref:phosphoglycerate kinase n=1 Tax=Maricaulis sp. TaxID=1486257 RepID=UPI001AFD4D99|nr:phosphoglycerate kinase [Maricaulis sp.]MBO6728213.1 phosphoglycerate kinase [Maricaulis sp.]MBO6846758.1 phosphoglycerate kinase [Maricaulis sp.]MBO6877881.1 phosphoglycerate kinase [Maricaulis sp.]